MPKNAIKGEMIGVQVTVFNYWDQPLEVGLFIQIIQAWTLTKSAISYEKI